MKINVFTPTCRHEGIKVVAHCLSRQTFKDFNWIIVDKDYDLDWYHDVIWKYALSVIYLPEKVQKPIKPYKINNARNTAYQFFDAELLVEIQDYHWFPPDTLQRFWDIYCKYPDALVSGVYKIVDMKDLHKCFEKEIITDEDLTIIDETCRPHKKGVIRIEPPFGWECNLSSLSVGILKLIGGWDEQMDDHYQMDILHISINADKMGCRMFLDTDIDYYSFEHKDLSSQDLMRNQRDAYINMAYLRRKYDIKLR